MGNYVEPTEKYLERLESQAREFRSRQTLNRKTREEYLAGLEREKAESKARHEREQKERKEQEAAAFRLQKQQRFMGTDAEFEKVWPQMLADESSRRESEDRARVLVHYGM